MPSAHHRVSLLHLRVALANALALIDQGLPGAARVTLPSALSVETELSDGVRKHRQHLPSDFAFIGGRTLRAEDHVRQGGVVLSGVPPSSAGLRLP